MIQGVKVKPLIIHKDVPDTELVVQPGFLMEILRCDEELFTKFGQSTMTVSYKGTIKGFHVHAIQDDLWFVASGRALIVLHDLRENSSTYKQTDTLYAGKDEYKLVSIPVGVAHGYKVLSDEPVMMFYHTTEPYDTAKPDEKRIAYNDPTINFDWNQYG